MWKNRLLYAAALFGIILFFIEYPGWISQYTLILVIALPFFSLVSSLLPARRLLVRLESPEAVRRGETLTLAVSADLRDGGKQETRGKSDLPCRLTLVTRNLRTGETETLRFMLAAGKKRHVRLPADHCCGVRAEIRKAGTYDPLGLFRIPVRTESARTVWILPVAKSPVPPPDFSAFRQIAVHPKRGGGFAEAYELREYRPGDPVRGIHWKLTAKTGRPILREAVEPEQRNVIVTLDLRKEPARFDTVMEESLFVAEELFERGIPFVMIWRMPGNEGLRTKEIRTRNQLGDAVRELLGTPVTAEPPSLAAVPLPDAVWRCHIDGEASHTGP